MLIYKVTNLVNGKIYVGQTVQSINARKLAHLAAARRNIDNAPLYLAMRKYGAENFQFEVLEQCTSIDQLNQQEKYWIAELSSKGGRLGYNRRTGGENSLHSVATKKKIATALIGNKNSAGFITPIEEVEKKLFDKFGDTVRIVKDSYKGVNQKAAFIDKDFGEWVTYVQNALVGQGHPQRALLGRVLKRLSPAEDLNAILAKQGSPSKLVPETYKGMLTKAKFIDKDFGEFEALPGNVIHQGSSHPKRAILRREITKKERGRYNARKSE